MVRPPAEFVEAAKDYVAVRVLNMKGIDLATYVFDYDLTLAVLLMNADGTIYHRFGGREWSDAEGRLSMKALVQLMKESLDDHRAYEKKPSPPKERPRRVIEEIPTMARKLKSQKVECFHCHMVNDAERSLAMEEKRFTGDEIWMWPLPERVGITLDVDDPTLVREVAADSAAAKAGLSKGDRLVRVGDFRVRSIADVQWALENAKTGPLEVETDNKKARLTLGKGWRVADPLDISWRPYMWGLRPMPGFGGRALAGEELAKLGVPFAIRIEYIVDWGEDAATGRNAAKAGLKKGDIVVGAGGRSDFKSELHFQAWFRLTQKAGSTIEFDVRRDGKPVKVTLEVLP